MRRKRVWLALLASAMVAGSASAATVVQSTLTGTSWNWFTTTTTTNDWIQVTSGGLGGNPITGFSNPLPGGYLESGDDYTTPGTGGQNFDIEQAFWGFDGSVQTGGVLYIGIVTGFDPTGERANGQNFYAGDLFLNLASATDTTTNVAPSASWDYAFGTSVGSDTPGHNTAAFDNHAPPLSSANPYESTTRLGTAWDLTGAGDTFTSVNVAGHTSVSDPYRVANATNGSFTNGGGSIDGFEVKWIMDFLGTGSEHNLLQVAIGLNTAQTSLLAQYGFGAHWTMLCGNDRLPIVGTASTLDIPLAPPPVPVPAAAPLGLVGMIAIGLFRKVRSKKS